MPFTDSQSERNGLQDHSLKVKIRVVITLRTWIRFGLRMARDHLQSRLVVILHADVAGSTKLVQRDEQRAHERIRDAFHLFDTNIGKYGGRVLELRGDALLAEFERASDAVSAALAFQSDHYALLANLDDDIRPELRVGIAMGEVVIADNTVTGEGVVLAQRVEQLAQPGGLCITAAIHEALPKRMPFGQESLGEQLLKGFDEPLQVYRVSLNPGTSLPSPGKNHTVEPATLKRRAGIAAAFVLVCTVVLISWLAPWKTATEQDEASVMTSRDAPSIAVLPFDNMSDEPAQQYLSDGISEDIITDLSKLKNLSVIARNSSFFFRETAAKVQEIGRDLGAQYLLEGSVRRSGNQIRITAQLIDVESGHHLWAERFDRELTEVFALQDEITQKIVTALSIQLTGDEQQQLARDATTSFEAYDLFLRGQELRADYSEEALENAMGMFRRAISTDPGFGRAYGALAIATMRQVFAGYSTAPTEAESRALELALEALRLDPDSAQVQWALGYVYLYRNQFDEAVGALERAIALSPSYADAYAMLALVRNNQGRGEEAIQLIERGIALNPHYSWDYLYNLGRAHYLLGHYQRAVGYLQQALTRNQSPSYPRIFLIASLVQMDRQDDAEWEVEQLGMFHPEMTLTHLRQTLPLSDTRLMDELLGDLRAAGLSE